MEWQHLILESFFHISQELENVLDGLTVDELNKHMAAGCNSIGWLTWHLTRSHDRNLSELLGIEQLWVKDRWYARFNRAPNPSETGFGQSAEDAAEFSAPNQSIILEYHWAVLELAKQYITNNLSETELKRQVKSPTLDNVATVRLRLLGIISEGFQHVGQAAYVRDLIKGQGWMNR